jgi:hypothetical protein
MILINQVFIRIIPENGRQKFQVDKMTLLALRFILALGLILPAGQAGVSTGPGTGFIPINDLGLRLYLDQFQGGLYAGGSNQVPPAHILAGLAHNAAIQPLDTAGRPDPAGRFVLLSVGMSNTTQEFWAANHRGPATAWSFAGQAAANSIVNHTTLAIVDGAMGGQAAHVWVSPSSPNYNRVRDEQLAPLGLTEAQVQAVWLKQADIQPTVPLPNANADAFILEKALGDIVRACRIRYPNLQIVFLSSRIYAGALRLRIGLLRPASRPGPDQPDGRRANRSDRWKLKPRQRRSAVDRVGALSLGGRPDASQRRFDLAAKRF